MEFTTTLEDFHTNIWRHHIVVPNSIAQKFIDGTHRRVICTVNNQEIVRSGLIASESGWFVLVNKEIRTKLGIEEGDKIHISIEKDTSEYGIDVPEELQVMLDQDVEAKKYFNDLSKSRQRSLIYIVAKVKNTESRINKALAIVHHLKEFRGILDPKKLNETIKYYNNRHKL